DPGERRGAHHERGEVEERQVHKFPRLESQVRRQEAEDRTHGRASQEAGRTTGCPAILGWPLGDPNRGSRRTGGLNRPRRRRGYHGLAVRAPDRFPLEIPPLEIAVTPGAGLDE